MSNTSNYIFFSFGRDQSYNRYLAHVKNVIHVNDIIVMPSLPIIYYRSRYNWNHVNKNKISYSEADNNYIFKNLVNFIVKLITLI